MDIIGLRNLVLAVARASWKVTRYGPSMLPDYGRAINALSQQCPDFIQYNTLLALSRSIALANRPVDLERLDATVQTILDLDDEPCFDEDLLRAELANERALAGVS